MITMLPQDAAVVAAASTVVVAVAVDASGGAASPLAWSPKAKVSFIHSRAPDVT